MFTDILKNCKNIKAIRNNTYIENDELKTKFEETIEGSYFAPSFITAEDSIIKSAKKNGFWIEIQFNETTTYKDYSFDILLINIKPKYNWLTFYRCTNGEYIGKCININLSGNTTALYNFIKNINKEN